MKAIIKIKSLIESIKNFKITTENYKQVFSLLSLFVVLITFIIGYIILHNTNAMICNYLLSINLILISNYIIYKL
jgi:hypothetical protein